MNKDSRFWFCIHLLHTMSNLLFQWNKIGNYSSYLFILKNGFYLFFICLFICLFVFCRFWFVQKEISRYMRLKRLVTVIKRRKVHCNIYALISRRWNFTIIKWCPISGCLINRFEIYFERFSVTYALNEELFFILCFI